MVKHEPYPPTRSETPSIDARSESSKRSRRSVHMVKKFLCIDCTKMDDTNHPDPIARYRPANGSKLEKEVKRRVRKGDYENAPNSFAGGTTGGAGAGGTC